jgi:hypothetical protein
MFYVRLKSLTALSSLIKERAVSDDKFLLCFYNLLLAYQGSVI